MKHLPTVLGLLFLLGSVSCQSERPDDDDDTTDDDDSSPDDDDSGADDDDSSATDDDDSTTDDDDTGTTDDDDDDVFSYGLLWDASEQTVDASFSLQMAFNNTPVSLRTPTTDELLIGYTDGGVPKVAKQDTSGAWTTQVLPTFTAAGVTTKVSMATMGTILVAGFVERTGPGRAVATLVRSPDDGQTWLTAQRLHPDPANQTNFALAVIDQTVASSALPVTAAIWTDNDGIRFSTCRGQSSAPMFCTPVQRLDNGSLAASDPTLFGEGSRLHALWEAGPQGSKELYQAVSSDGGLTWAPATALPLTGFTHASNFGDPSACRTLDGTMWVAYQAAQATHLASSTDLGNSWQYQQELGPGLFAHIECSGTSVAVMWEHFSGNQLDDTLKTVGTTLTLDQYATQEGPHLMPDSEITTSRTLAHGFLNDDRIELFWIDVSSGDRTLMHRGALLP